MSQQSANNKMVIKLVAIVIGMFGFGFALVPLYDVFCDVTGINGKPKARLRFINRLRLMSREK